MNHSSKIDLVSDLSPQELSNSDKSIPAIDISRITGDVEEPKKDYASIHQFFDDEDDIVDAIDSDREEGEIIDSKSGEEKEEILEGNLDDKKEDWQTI